MKKLPAPDGRTAEGAASDALVSRLLQESSPDSTSTFFINSILCTNVSHRNAFPGLIVEAGIQSIALDLYG